ncbi:cytochrome c oxidase polypeptide vib [Stagonosporopsis vannaccii]|nr:cytochrome c oxidase polypeptide vib [Stagonosporopsis vannaccii]
MSDNENGDEMVTKPFNWYDDPRAPAAPRTCTMAPLSSLGPATDPTNQTKHCWQNYVDYHKCIIAKGEDFAPCRQFMLAYKSLCPSGWTARWDDQREAGNFPVNLNQ